MQQPDSIFEEKLTPELTAAISQVSRWIKLISVIGFALGAFVVVIMLFYGAAIFEKIIAQLNLPVQAVYSALIITFFIFFFIIAAVLYFLYKSAMLLREGAVKNDSFLMAEGFGFLTKFFIITAIYNAIALIGYIIILFN